MGDDLVQCGFPRGYGGVRRLGGVLARLAACKAVDEDQADRDAHLSPPSAATANGGRFARFFAQTWSLLENFVLSCVRGWGGIARVVRSGLIHGLKKGDILYRYFVRSIPT